MKHRSLFVCVYFRCNSGVPTFTKCPNHPHLPRPSWAGQKLQFVLIYRRFSFCTYFLNLLVLFNFPFLYFHAISSNSPNEVLSRLFNSRTHFRRRLFFLLVDFFPSSNVQVQEYRAFAATCFTILTLNKLIFLLCDFLFV